MPDSCCSVGCNDRRAKNPGRSYFRIPTEEQNPERRKLWLRAIARRPARGEGKEWRPSRNMRVCGKHFIRGVKSEDPLSPDWVPSIFSHTTAANLKKRKKDMERYEQFCKMQNDEEKKQKAVDVLLDLPDTEDEQQCDDILCKIRFARLQRECNNVREENRQLKDIVKAGTFDQLAFEKDDSKVNTMTGIPTYSKLQVVLTFVISFLSTRISLSPFQQLLLTLMRLKMNLPLTLLACIFKISIPTASRTFSNAIKAMNTSLVPALVFWPNREELHQSMPVAFRQVFCNCACIIDCCEIFIEEPTGLSAKAETYSKHKHHHTMKYLIGITPQGTVSFISKACGGRTSDKHLAERSGFLDLLDTGDVILADRGYDVADAVDPCNAEFKILAFSKAKKQLSPVELESIQGLASVRIHAERVIGQARNRYAILESTIGIKMCKVEYPNGLTLLDKIVQVCYALTNLAP